MCPVYQAVLSLQGIKYKDVKLMHVPQFVHQLIYRALLLIPVRQRTLIPLLLVEKVIGMRLLRWEQLMVFLDELTHQILCAYTRKLLVLKVVVFLVPKVEGLHAEC